MTQRERFLAILVGGGVLLVVLQWCFTSYRGAVQQRQTKLSTVSNQIKTRTEMQLMGEIAAVRMDDYALRSLPSDINQARSLYTGWLLSVMNSNNAKDIKVMPSTPMPVRANKPDGYDRLATRLPFNVTGNSEIEDLLAILHDIQAKGFLHRIKKVDFKPSRRGEGFDFSLDIHALALATAPEEPREKDHGAWRVEPDLEGYKNVILNRNLFEPPNNKPSFAGIRALEGIIGRDESFTLAFKDAEDHALSYEIIDGPGNAQIDSRTGTLRIRSDEVSELEVTVRAIDDGYPKQTTEETLVIKFVEPPPPEEPEPEPLKFDDAKQSYLTGLVQGANDWTAWINVRTQGKTLKLRVGDEFQIGSVRGTITSINADQVEIKLDDKLVTLTSKVALKDAVDQASE
ncbi:hypothetical protein SV7mr_36320 [Stieleria bergensis]|uniref:Cadherin domain-containing protein n=1 Tax=Stieleria bergensis TaxID=2528025 RepID=A0A517SYJ0_9BACT|nr:hypothetical protein SV7mr_36320 [Planctomycetes bacterium SV_7m_r]